MEQWTKEWIETALIAAMRHADDVPIGTHYCAFLSFFEGWLREGGLGQEAQDALELLHRRAQKVEVEE